MKDLTIIKVGGSVITDKNSQSPKARLEVIGRISKELYEFYKKGKSPMVLIHGAGSYGHAIVKRTGIDKGIKNETQKLDFAETQKLVTELNCIVTESLIIAGVPAFPCQASSTAIMKGGKLVSMDLTSIIGMVGEGIVPVLYGVPAYDSVQKCSILSGDAIMPYMASKMGAEKILSATNVDGVFTADPKKNSNAKLIPEISRTNIDSIRKCLSGSASTDVTGGMLGKVTELLDMGIESQIVNAETPGNILRALSGERIGTIIRC